MAKKRSVEQLANIEAMELDKTLVIDGNVYNINAVEADTAKKVNNKLTINEIDFDGNIVPAVEFDGSEDKEISDYDELKANSISFSSVNATQGTSINLKNNGYYKFLAVINLSNEKTVEIVYTIAN